MVRIQDCNPNKVQSSKYKGQRRISNTLVLISPKQQCSIRPPKSETIGKNIIYYCLTRFIWDVVEIAIRIRIHVVDCRRKNIAMDSQHGENSFNATGRPKQVASHRLGRADSEFISVLPEGIFDRERLKFVVVRRRCSVCVYVTDLIGADAGILDRPLHYS